jgi:hypothetical protein
MSDVQEQQFNQALAHERRTFERHIQAIFPDKPQFLPAGSGAPTAAEMAEQNAAEAEWLAATAELERINNDAS